MSSTKKADKRGRGRPVTGRARPHRVQICLADTSVDAIAAALVRAHGTPEQQAIPQERSRIATARLLGELVELAAARHPELVEEIARRHGAGELARMKAREDKIAA